MTDSFVTQCPQCQTRFRVTHHQLSVARGVVRCGQCLQVFSAAKQLLEQSQAATGQALAAAAEGLQPAVTAAKPTEPSLPPVPVAPVASSQADWDATHSALDALDLDQALANLERRHVAAPSNDAAQRTPLQARRDDAGLDEHLHEPFGTAERGHADEPAVPFAPVPTLVETPQADEHHDEPRTEPTLRLDAVAPELLADEQPRLGRPLSDERLTSLGSLSALDDEPHGERLSAHEEADEPSPEQDPEERLEPSLGPRPSRGHRSEPLIDVVDDPLQLGWEAPPPRWGRRLLWGLACVLALGLLAYQYVAYHFDELARQDSYRPLFQQVCPLVGCTVPTRVDVQRIKSSNLVVRSHPDFKGALIVDAIIYNRAPFSQPFPQLELRFADLNGQLIASRRFKPSEYLSGELAGRGDMPSQTPIHIALDILDPGPKAVNYSLSFRSPE